MNLLNNKIITSFLLMNALCMLSVYSFATPTPILTPTPIFTPTPKPATYSLTIQKDTTHCDPGCCGCTYEVYVDGTEYEDLVAHNIPATIYLAEGVHDIYLYEVSSLNIGGIYFMHWEDDSIELWPRSIDIHENTTWMMHCCYVPCTQILPHCLPDICINEIGWMGTQADADCKWIELYNSEDFAIGLYYMHLSGQDMDLHFTSNWAIPNRKAILPHSYFLIEVSENCVNDMPGDILTSDLTLPSEGNHLLLLYNNPSYDDYIIDEIDCSSGWFAGNENYYYSMERKYPHAGYGNETDNWADWNGSTWSGRDANGDPLSATVISINTVYSFIWPPPTPAPTPIFLDLDGCDYNGDGTADIAVFRRSSGLWAIRNLTRAYFGSSLDTPVPGDYDGDWTTDIGIFRPSTGLWAIRNVSRAYFGSSEDTPVPLRFNPSSACKIGIFRESTGLWAIKDATRVYFGSSGDVPVPGDYNGDGTKDLGIFRGSSGLWALREVSRFYFGQSTDTAIPGNYGGDGTYSAAVFRGSSELWAIRGISRIYFGSIGDWAVPADYRGDGTPAVGIFRESSGLWAVRGVTRVYYGTIGDIPVIR